jgi:hypothetical protein
MCAACDALLRPISVDSASYIAVATMIHGALAAGTLEQMDGPPVAEERPISAKCTFACTECSQLFILEIGGCHLLGDQWRPLHGN